MTEPLLQTDRLQKHFPLVQSFSDWVRRQTPLAIHAVDDVSLEVARGEALGLIGESGSGKTTFGWLVARLHEPTGGTIRFDGEEITRLGGEALRRWRRNVQVVFQDPVGSLDPRMRVWEIVGEPLQSQERLKKAQVRQRVLELLPTVGLPPDCLDQYAYEFSGGGRQRISLARALALRPKLLVLDEPTSALDVAVQAQILNRLVELQRELGLAYLLITHNVAAVRFVADRVVVMYAAKIAESAPTRELLEHPLHPYTKALLAAVPVADVRRRRARYRIGGEVPTLIHPPPGCRFAPRCPFAIQRCRDEEPLLRPIAEAPGRLVACHRAEEIVDVRPEALLSFEMGTALSVPTSEGSLPSTSAA
jgi:peptide/nickel transport system ATP-binding protein